MEIMAFNPYVNLANVRKNASAQKRIEAAKRDLDRMQKVYDDIRAREWYSEQWADSNTAFSMVRMLKIVVENLEAVAKIKA